MGQIYQGISASQGLAMGPAYVFQTESFSLEPYAIEDVEAEHARLDQALAESTDQIRRLKAQAIPKVGPEEAAIFDAQIMMVNDPEFVKQMKQHCRENLLNIENSVQQITASFIRLFESMAENPYMAERANDIRDIERRLLANLTQADPQDLGLIQDEVILVVDNLTPSDTVQLDPKYIKGFVTAEGGATSHMAILARALGIPAVVGLYDQVEKIESGDDLIIQADKGLVIHRPDPGQIHSYYLEKDLRQSQEEEWAPYLHEETVTQDGKRIPIRANISRPQDAFLSYRQGAEGIGLYRTEFLFMNSLQLPGEEDQYKAYRQVLEASDQPVVIRTMDIGGDKEVPQLGLKKEDNPFLGYRAIRILLDRQDIFETQLRALYRASHYGNLKIMIPMVATLDEWRQTKAITRKVQRDLKREGYAFNSQVPLGMMVEVPSVIFLMDEFAKEADFFSIGSNDLVQYLMAADRMNEQVAYLNQTLNPAVLRAIKHVVSRAHARGKKVKICGEMASDPLAVPLLIGLGIDDLSMSSSNILKIRSLIKKLDSQAMEELATQATTHCSTHGQVEVLVQDFYKKHGISL